MLAAVMTELTLLLLLLLLMMMMMMMVYLTCCRWCTHGRRHGFESGGTIL